MNRALRAATVGVLLFSPVALGACSAGQVTQTATQERDKTGATAQVGDITVRSATLVYPNGGRYEQGDDAELAMAIVSGGTEGDTLLRITGEGFGSAEIAPESATATASGSATPSGAPATPSDGSASPSAPATSESATPTPEATPSSTPATSSAPVSSPLEIPRGGSVFVGPDGDATITLTDLQDSLTTGQYIELTLTFQNAGDLKLLVTVDNPPHTQDRSHAFDFHEETNE